MMMFALNPRAIEPSQFYALYDSTSLFMKHLGGW